MWHRLDEPRWWCGDFVPRRSPAAAAAAADDDNDVEDDGATKAAKDVRVLLLH